MNGWSRSDEPQEKSSSPGLTGDPASEVSAASGNCG